MYSVDNNRIVPLNVTLKFEFFMWLWMSISIIDCSCKRFNLISQQRIRASQGCWHKYFFRTLVDYTLTTVQLRELLGCKF